MTYDWSDEDDIQWAAFYSDCEHEVHEVTSGHRITLTYNLYAHEQLGGCFRNPSTVATDSFSLYHCVKEALASPDFLPKGMSRACFLVLHAHLLPSGGFLGFHCVHAYPHANDKITKTMPFALKGVDAMIFSMFHSLHLKVGMHGVLEGKSILASATEINGIGACQRFP